MVHVESLDTCILSLSRGDAPVRNSSSQNRQRIRTLGLRTLEFTSGSPRAAARILSKYFVNPNREDDESFEEPGPQGKAPDLRLVPFLDRLD